MADEEQTLSDGGKGVPVQEATSQEGTTEAAAALTDDTKAKIISGLSKSNSEKDNEIKALQAKLAAKDAKPSEEEAKEKATILERRAALADFIGDEKYGPILPILKNLAESGDVKPTKELADMLLDQVPQSSGPRTGAGKTAKEASDETDRVLKSTNVWGEPLAGRQ